MDKKVEIEIEKASQSLLKMANDTCNNKFSENLFYILSNETEAKGKNFFIQRANRKIINSKKALKNFKEIISELSDFYENIYDLNLYIYKSEKNKTIIEIRYYLKKELEQEYLKTVINNPSMLHCKIQFPPYLKNKEEKFDVNWTLGGIKDTWKMFWWKSKRQVFQSLN